MDDSDSPSTPPPVAALGSTFHVYQVHQDGNRLLYVGEPLVPPDRIERELWELFDERGYDLSLERNYRPRSDVALPTHGWVLVARPRSRGLEGVPWTNVVLALLTMGSTLVVGAYQWYHVDPLGNPAGLLVACTNVALAVQSVGSTLLIGAVQWYHVDPGGNPFGLLVAWPFVAAVLGVLAVHELGHYVASRYHGVDASLPYFIPFPTLIGTMGAVIRVRGRIPDRKALFDIGAAGPLAGLAATVVVSVVGLQLEPVAGEEIARSSGPVVEFHFPLLLQWIAALTGTLGKLEAGNYHPVVFGAWVGMFITFLNLLPVGQLDGGHIVRALFGERQETVAAFVPGVLFGLAGYLYFLQDVADAVGIWIMWGLLATGMAVAGPATPIRDSPLGHKRIAVGGLTFMLGILCFTPVPFEIVRPA